MSELNLFNRLHIETSGYCNRRCPTCIRNSYPDRNKASPWFEHSYLSLNIIEAILVEACQLGFSGPVCFSHFNEPLLDERIGEIIHLAKSFHQFSSIFLHTNGDYLNKEIASQLDGELDKIVVSLYMEEPIKSERVSQIKSLFSKTYAEILTYSAHITTHFSPREELSSLISTYQTHPCTIIRYDCIINHRGQYLLCCEDFLGHFDLGNFPEISLRDYWFGAKHRLIVNNLWRGNQRMNYPYCSICPKS